MLHCGREGITSLRPPPSHAPLFFPSPAERHAHLPPPAADPHPYSLTGVKMPHSVLISSPDPSATPSTTPFPLPSISQQPLAFVLVALLLLHCPEKLKGLQEEGEQTAAKTGDAHIRARDRWEIRETVESHFQILQRPICCSFIQHLVTKDLSERRIVSSLEMYNAVYLHLHNSLSIKDFYFTFKRMRTYLKSPCMYRLPHSFPESSSSSSAT